ncbi:hypothetical protein [Actinospica robiniae]|uniref:hypothetical protein n=1 Tax=Actinospica robiniae TaxID=304901 RepID=UPI00040567A9|nr:hypothetical protein [Actinospica robiniae]
MRVRAALSVVLCLTFASVAGPVAAAAAASSAPSSLAVTPATAASCGSGDLAMSASGGGVEALSPGARSIESVTLRNSSSADCPVSGFDVVLLQNGQNPPEPTLQWRVDGGAWRGASLSRDHGSSSDPLCASPCWKTNLIAIDVPAKRTLTIDIALIFQSAGYTSEGFSGAASYVDDTAFPQYLNGPLLYWSYDNAQASSKGSGTGSGGGVSSSGSGGSKSSVVSSRTPAPSPTHSAAPSPKASPSPSQSASAASPSARSSSPAAVPSPRTAAVADVRSSGSGMSGVIALIALVVLALAAGAGFVLMRRRRAGQATGES